MKLLPINIYINAWLDCSRPSISIHNKLDDDLLAHFDSESVELLIESGELSVEDLKSTNRSVLADVITTLLAIKSSKAITEQMQDIGASLVRREDIFPNVVRISEKTGFQTAKLAPLALSHAI